jgi:uncharacterized protein (TIGR00369 family)
VSGELGRQSGLDRAQPSALAVRSPAYALFGVRVDSVSLGTSDYSMRLAPRFADGAGRLAGGTLGMIADASLGNAALTQLPAGQASSTSQLRLDFVGQLPPAAGRVSAHAHVAGGDGATIFVTGDVRDEGGAVVAVTSARCVVVASAYPAWTSIGVRPAADPSSSVDELLGLRSSRVDPAGLQCAFAPSSAHSNIFGIVHGGVLAAVVDRAGTQLVEAAGELCPLDLRVRYLRPVPTDGGDCTVTARLVHRTRRQAAVEMAIHRGGELLVSAQGTYLLEKAAA